MSWVRLGSQIGVRPGPCLEEAPSLVGQQAQTEEINFIMEVTLGIPEKGLLNQAVGIKESFLEEAVLELGFDG